MEKTVVQQMTSNRNIFYYFHQYWIDESDPRPRGFPLVDGGPGRILTLMGAYLLFVKVIGPMLMKDRRPLKLRWPMFAYNTSMVTVNFYLFLEIVKYSNYGKSVFCM